MRTSILLAVSGGPDSMALLDASSHLAGTLGLRLEVATVDHGLRRASGKDAALVERAARRRGLPCSVLRVDVGEGPGLEARARQGRYQALEEARRARGLALIATAHTATDQAETLLMRLARGAALGGAAGILARRGAIVRPLLTCTRADVEGYVRARRLRVATDPMNRDPAFTRVRVRRRLLPALEQVFGPTAVEALARFARLAREDDALLDEWAAAAWRRLSLDGAGGLDAVGLRALPVPLRRRVLAHLLAQEGLPADGALLERMDQAVRDGARTPLPQRADLCARGGRVRIERAVAAAEAESAWEVRRGDPAVRAGGWQVSWQASPREDAAVTHPLLSPIAGDQLVLRFRRPGDRVRLASGRSRKLQDVLVDARVPRERRDRVLVAVDEEGRIHCAVGVWPVRGAAISGWLCADGPSGRRPAGERRPSPL